jgi:competence ComEA-like helix-hairpin-helix protein
MIQIVIATLLLFVSWGIPTKPATVEIENYGNDTVVLIEGQELWCEECNPLLFGEKINVNVASYDVLLNLPYIGEKRARQIVTWREKNGAFSSIEELEKIKGIGSKTVMKIEPYAKIQ